MKKINILSSLLALVLLVSGCTAKIEYPIENEHYTIYEEDGRCFLEIDPVPDILDEDGSIGGVFVNYSKSVFGIPSVQALRRAVLSGDFDKYDGSGLFGIQAKADAFDGRFEIYDLRNLWDLQKPDGVEIYDILWQYSQYCFRCTTENNETVSVRVSTEDTYQNYKRGYFEERDNDWEIHSKTKLSDRNATQTLYKNGYKELRYEITDGNRTIWVYEEYSPWSDNPEVPWIVVFGSDGNEQEGAFYATTGIKKRPTVEWLTSFGLKKVR